MRWAFFRIHFCLKLLHICCACDVSCCSCMFVHIYITRVSVYWLYVYRGDSLTLSRWIHILGEVSTKFVERLRERRFRVFSWEGLGRESTYATSTSRFITFCHGIFDGFTVFKKWFVTICQDFGLHIDSHAHFRNKGCLRFFIDFPQSSGFPTDSNKCHQNQM